MTDPDGGESSLTLWEIVFAGLSLHTLADITADAPIVSASDYQLGVLDHCRNLLEFIERFELESCERHVGERLKKITMELEERSEDSPNSILGDLESRLKTVARDLRMRLEKEGLSRTVFVSTPERTISVEDLLDDPGRWFGLSFGAAIEPPKGVLDDFQEAARAFAVGFAPAAIVFTLRATEGMLREYYRAVTNNEPNPRATWGSLTRRLRQSGQCDSQLLQKLDSLRDLRNDVMHAGYRDPEKWDDEAARDTLLQCREIITAMCTHVEQFGE